MFLLPAFDCPPCSAVEDATSLKWSQLTHTVLRSGLAAGTELDCVTMNGSDGAKARPVS